MRIVRNNTKKLFLYTGLFGLTLSVLSVGLGAYFSTQTAYAYSADAFVMKVDTRKSDPDNTRFTIPVLGEDYNFTIDCDDNGPMESVSGVTSTYTCEYPTPGVYTVTITGEFPHVSLYHLEDELEGIANAKNLISVEQWGTQQWRSMEYMFAFAPNMNISPSAGVPDLSQVTSMAGMFYYASAFNSPLNDWGVGHVTNMEGMFVGAASFSQPLDSWDVSNVTNMEVMFYMASSFDYSLGAWYLNNEVNTESMLASSAYSAASYDATLKAWASRDDVPESVSFDGRGLQYCASAEARAELIEVHGWSIENDIENCAVVYPTITGVEIKPEGERQVMTVTGENLLLGLGDSLDQNMAPIAAIVYGGQVYVNGEKYSWCVPDGFPREDLVHLTASDSPPCFYYWNLETDQPLFSDTQFKIWLPNDFDITAPGTVRIWKTPEFKFNQPVASPVVVQPLTAVAADASIAAPLRTATLGVSDSEVHRGCASIDTSSTHLLAPDTVTAPNGTTLLGGVGFELDCVVSGGSALVSLRLGQEYEDISLLSAYKDLAGDGNLTPVDVTFVNRDGATYVEFPLTDGLTDTPTGLVDEDGVEDGRIVDPLYIGIQTSASSAQDGGMVTPAVGAMAPGAPNSGFGATINTLASQTATLLWIVAGAALGAAAIFVGVLLRRQTRTP